MHGLWKVVWKKLKSRTSVRTQKQVLNVGMAGIWLKIVCVFSLLDFTKRTAISFSTKVALSRGSNHNLLSQELLWSRLNHCICHFSPKTWQVEHEMLPKSEIFKTHWAFDLHGVKPKDFETVVMVWSETEHIVPFWQKEQTICTRFFLFLNLLCKCVKIV